MDSPSLGEYRTLQEPASPSWYNLALPFSERRLLLIVGDILCLLLSGLLVFAAHAILQYNTLINPKVFQGQSPWLLFIGLSWLILAMINECYDIRLASHPVSIFQRLLLSTAEVGVLYLVAFFMFGRPSSFAGFAAPFEPLLSILSSPPRLIPGAFMLVATASIALWRLGYIGLFSRPTLRRRALVVGAGQSGRALVESIRGAVPGYEIVGFIDDDVSKQGTTVCGLPVLASHASLLWYAENRSVNEIILAITHDIDADLFRVLMDCYEKGFAIVTMPRLYEEALGRVPVEHLGRKVSHWQSSTHPTFYRAFKRVADVLLTLLGLTLLIPLFPLVALAIYLESPGSIFYRQERLGQRGKPFKILKFRSMIPDAEKEGQAVWATENDPRVTRVGRFLRRTRLDEVPQLWNVLRGDMSLVGPRPERAYFVAQLQEEIPFYRMRLSVKPGLTGWAQIHYRYGNSVDDALIKLQYDLYYIKNQSFVLDLLIMLRTIKVMLMFRGT